MEIICSSLFRIMTILQTFIKSRIYILYNMVQELDILDTSVVLERLSDIEKSIELAATEMPAYMLIGFLAHMQKRYMDGLDEYEENI
jgi:hypothetical protein